MALRLSGDVRQALTDAFTSRLDLGSANPNARLHIYTGIQPASPASSPTGTLLVTLDFANPAFDPADADGQTDLNGGTPISGIVTTAGTAGWFRVVDRDGVGILDGSITLVGDAGDMAFANTSFLIHGEVKVDSWLVRQSI